MANKELQYRTFNELLDEVKLDFNMYELENMIDPAQLIKVAQRVSYDLGLRIHLDKQKVIDFEGNKVRLPNDFYSLTSAVLCSNYTLKEEVLQGTHTEDIILDPANCTSCGEPDPTCACEKTYTVCEDRYIKVMHRRAFVTREFTEFKRLYIRAAQGVDPLCSQVDKRETPYQAELRNGFLYMTGIDSGTVYINYLGTLEDDNGNLLVLDHPMCNEYYEYALKQRILENLYMNGEDVAQKMQLIEQRLRAARNNALSIVNTPNFKEMYELWKNNRRAMYARYYDMFKSHYYINM